MATNCETVHQTDLNADSQLEPVFIPVLDWDTCPRAGQSEPRGDRVGSDNNPNEEASNHANDHGRLLN